jgi:thiamine monophosphate kinase
MQQTHPEAAIALALGAGDDYELCLRCHRKRLHWKTAWPPYQIGTIRAQPGLATLSQWEYLP